jgi:WD40 repeat protein
MKSFAPAQDSLRLDPFIHTGHTQQLTSVALSADGKLVVAAAGNGAAFLWDAASGQKLQTFGGHQLGVTSVALSGDGKFVVTGSGDNTAILWQADGGKRLQIFDGHTALEEVRREAAARAAEARRKARLVEAHLALERAMNHCQRNEVAEGLVWLARGLEVVPEDEADLQLSFRRLLRSWSRHAHALQQILPIASPRLQISLSPDGKIFATGREKPAGVQMWDAVTGKPLGEAIPQRRDPSRLTFSPDGTLLAIVSDSASSFTRDVLASVRFWDVATRKPVGEPILTRALRVDFSPTGKRLVTFQGRNVRLWEVPQGKAIGGPLPTKAVHTAAFSPNGKALLTGGDELRCWDASNGKPIGSPIQPSEELTTAAAFSPDGKTFLAGGSSQNQQGPLFSLRIFDTATRKLICEYRLLMPWVAREVAFGPDGESVLVCYDDPEKARRFVQLFRCRPAIDQWKVIGAPIPVPPWTLSFAFSADGKAVLLVNHASEAQLWNTQTGQPLGDIPQTGGVYWVGSDPDGKTMLTSSGSDIRRWEVALLPTGRKLEWSGEGGFRSPAFSPDGKKLAMAVDSRDRSEVRFWNPVTARPTGETIPFGDGKPRVCYVAYSPDGKVLLTVDARYPPDEAHPANVRLWSSTTRKLIGDAIPVEWPAVYWVSGGATVAFSPDSKRLLVACGKLAHLYDTATGKPAGRPLEHPGVIRAVAFGPDGERLLTGGDDKTARFWEAATGQPVGEPLKHPAAVNLVAFSPDGKKVLTNEGQTVRLWNAGTGQRIGEPIRAARAGSPLSFSPDGKTLLINHGEAARLWDTETGKPHGRYLHHRAHIVETAFSPDGRTIMTVGRDLTQGVQLWDAVTAWPIGKVLWTHGNEGTVISRSALFSPDSRTLLATASFEERRSGLLAPRYFEEARLFDVPQPVQGDAAQLRLWVEVITARELDAGGEIADLDAKTWQQRWQQLQKVGVPPVRKGRD